MSLIKIDNLTFSYYGSGGDIFENVSFSFDTSWKTGLIGRNGIGKSTLFKLLLGKESYQGAIKKSVECIEFPPEVDDETKVGLELFHLYDPMQEEWKLFRELNLLKIDECLLYRPFNTLSKGEQTKILLAILFTTENGFLLIDEPTNHLDLYGREVVSEYLKSKNGFLLISHDRDFLDKCIDHVISINRNSIDVQVGNFTSWYENKMRKDQFEIAENEKLKKNIKRLKGAAKQSEGWSEKVEKTKTGTKASGSKPDRGYIGHQAAKMMKRSKNLEGRQHKAIEDKEKLLKDVEAKERLMLNSLQHHKDVLVSMENISAFYEETQVLRDVSFEIKQGDRIAIAGGNGSGKSTLLKILLGENIEYTGNIQLAPHLKLSYIPQETLHLNGSLKDFIRTQEVDETLCKTILSKLDFPKDIFDLGLESYSDGQKKKVLLAASLSKQAHLFIWDEPLNYIDVISRMQIEEIISNERPTLIFIEHDKKFVDSVATKKIELP